MQMEFDHWKAELDARTKIEVAEIAAQSALDAAEIKGANAGVEGDASGADSAPAGKKVTGSKRPSVLDKFAEMHKQSMDMMGKMTETMKNPPSRKVIRGPDGKIQGVQ